MQCQSARRVSLTTAFVARCYRKKGGWRVRLYGESEERRSSKQTKQCPAVQMQIFSGSDSTERDDTVVTVHSSLPYPSMSPANWLTGLLGPNC